VKRYADTVINRDGPMCRCGNYNCAPEDDPYCRYSPLYCGNRRAGNYCALEPTPPDGPSLVAEWDRRAKARREDVAAEFQAFDQQRKEAKKRTRRTRKEMEAHRQAVQERIQKSYRELVGDGTADWLDESDPMVDVILKGDSLA
jgi:hypothetical protein